MIIILFFVLHWYLSLFMQSFFQHRYASHGAFTMNKGWERIFFIFTFLFQGSSFMNTKAYAIMHRMHHAFTDTDKDPHSPKFSKNIFNMMWNTRRVYLNILRNREVVDEKYLKNLPEWKFVDKVGHSLMTRIVWALVYIAFYILFATSPWLFLLLPVHFVMGPIHGAIINWYAHKFGKVNFKMSNTSKNLFVFDIIMLGEGLHNNHHKFPASANFGRKGFEFDPCYPLILMFKALGIIKLNKQLSVAQ